MWIYYFEDYEYQPWEDTLLHLPITDEDTSSIVYDNSWNWNNANWYWTAQYETLSSWKRILSFSWSQWLYLWTKLLTNQPYTIVMRVQKNWSQSSDATIVSNQRDSWNYWQVIAFNWSNQVYTFYGNGSNAWLTMTDVLTFDNDVWIQYTVTVDWNIIKKYVNWQLAQTVTNSQAPAFANATNLSIWYLQSNWSTSNFRFFKWKIWELIIETWKRDEQSIKDYNNWTKSLYWIS